MQSVIVYIIIGIALAGLGRFLYRKIKAIKKDKECSECTSCPLKDGCKKREKIV